MNFYDLAMLLGIGAIIFQIFIVGGTIPWKVIWDNPYAFLGIILFGMGFLLNPRLENREDDLEGEKK